MSNKITSIERIDNDEGGYIVHTEKHRIQLLIENTLSCCEDWGFMTSEDNPSDFVGAEFIDLKIVDDSYNVIDFGYSLQYRGGLEEGKAVFINMETDRGVLQFVLYNAHNGYYGHDCKITIDDNVLFEATL